MLRFAVSSTAFRSIPLEQAIENCRDNDWILEFASGIPFSENSAELFLQAPCKKLIHNYFPAPREPFVLNLASLNTDTLTKSIQHVKMALNLARQVGCGFYSVHAGFCMDPSPSELGRPFDLKMRHPRAKHWQQFLKSLEELLGVARTLNVKLLIENNVLAPFNLKNGSESPTLCADDKEMAALVETFHDFEAFGILLDTGHLKVSQKTIGFDTAVFLDVIKNHTLQIHHSDNNSLEDSNNPLFEDYWFLKHVCDFSNAIHTLEVHDQSINQIRVQQQLLTGASP